MSGFFFCFSFLAKDFGVWASLSLSPTLRQLTLLFLSRRCRSNYVNPNAKAHDVVKNN